MFESILCQVTECDPDVLESLIGLTVEIAREGREGRRIGRLLCDPRDKNSRPKEAGGVLIPSSGRIASVSASWTLRITRCVIHVNQRKPRSVSRRNESSSPISSSPRPIDLLNFFLSQWNPISSTRIQHEELAIGDNQSLTV